MQDKDSIRSSINKRMNVVHRCIRTPNIVLRALILFSITVAAKLALRYLSASYQFCGFVASLPVAELARKVVSIYPNVHSVN